MRKLLLLGVLARSALFGDGGTLQFRRETPELSVTVFTSPAPLSSGPADISILLQKRETLEPVLDADVSIFMRNVVLGNDVHARATREQAQNKLLYAAPITLGESGRWQLKVKILRFGVTSEIAPRKTWRRRHLGRVSCGRDCWEGDGGSPTWFSLASRFCDPRN